MNDSFGGKYTVSSTKSFQTHQTQQKNNLNQQILNYQNALKTAEKLMQNYQQENLRLFQENKKTIQQNQNLRQSLFVEKQKFSVLQHLLMKMTNQKQKELIKLTKKVKQNSHQKQKALTNKYQKHIEHLNETIDILKKQLAQQNRKNKQKTTQTEQDQFQCHRKNKQSINKFKTTIDRNCFFDEKNPEIILKISLQTDRNRKIYQNKLKKVKIQSQRFKDLTKSFQRTQYLNFSPIKNNKLIREQICDSPNNQKTISKLKKSYHRQTDKKNETFQNIQKQYNRVF